MPTKKAKDGAEKIRQEAGNQEVTDQTIWDFFSKRIQDKQLEIDNHMFNV